MKVTLFLLFKNFLLQKQYLHCIFKAFIQANVVLSIMFIKFYSTKIIIGVNFIFHTKVLWPKHTWKLSPFHRETTSNVPNGLVFRFRNVFSQYQKVKHILLIYRIIFLFSAIISLIYPTIMSSLSINLSPSHFCVSFNIRRGVFLISRNRRNCTRCRPLGRKRTRAPIIKRRQRGAADVGRSRKRRRKTCYIYR